MGTIRRFGPLPRVFPRKLLPVKIPPPPWELSDCFATVFRNAVIPRVGRPRLDCYAHKSVGDLQRALPLSNTSDAGILPIVDAVATEHRIGTCRNQVRPASGLHFPGLLQQASDLRRSNPVRRLAA
jgi:hypothetical protein